MRKIIFSRKGFDSGKKTGNGASPFVRDGEMVSFPIPPTCDSDLVPYAEIFPVEGVSLKERIRQLRGTRKPFPYECCHHDPDLVRDVRERDVREQSALADWRGILGQSGGPQTHLQNNCVGIGSNGIDDLFLFFGLFKEAEINRLGELRPLRGAPEVHALFGYLQVGHFFSVPVDGKLPDKYQCYADHPHLNAPRLEERARETQERRKQGKPPKPDVVYIASDHLSLPGVGDLPGWGVFRHSPELQLTADGENTTVWDFPKLFRGRYISWQSENPWREDGLLKTSSRGQEFVMDADDEGAAQWAADLICRHYSRS